VAELRKDWLTGRTVILAENRANRPNEFAIGADGSGISSAAGGAVCPFCPGQESLTPPAVYEQADGDGRWRVRVVPNKYPALTLEADTPAAAAAALGAHEVVVESARHVDRVSDLSPAEFAHVLEAYAARLGHWHDDGRFEFGLVFKNRGPIAGATLAHLHSQLVALPALPPKVAAEFERAEQSFRGHRNCPYCRLIEDERTAGERVVLERDGLIAFCPLASLQPYEVWLLPTAHEPWFERWWSAGEAGERLAATLHLLVARLEAIVPASAYNLLLRTAPWRESALRCGHWRIEVLPRTNSLAGLELATGIHINPLSPAHAAERLRSG
jgi:UDPglucose--hexose-1-phosphate uridylyltransferase